MKVTIKTSKGQLYTVEVSSDEECVSALKSNLSSQISIPQEKIRLICAGRLLKDDQTLKSYSLTDSSVIHLVIPGAEKKSVSAPAPTMQNTQAPNASPVPPTPSAPFGGQHGSSTPGLGGIDQNVLQALAANMGNMWGNNSGSGTPNPSGAPGAAGAAGAMDAKIMELLKNPEILRMFLESYFPNQSAYPTTKEFAMENLQKLIEMYKSNPEQYNALLNYATSNPEIFKSINNNLFANMGNPGHVHGAGASAGANPGGMPNPQHNNAFGYGVPQFDRKAAMEKYSAQLAELETIGYVNKEMNLIALVYTEGDLEKAVNLLLDWSNDQ